VQTSKRTPLHALHQELGAKMVPFAGYEMPVRYPSGIMAEHRHTRRYAGLFDVSHMGQARLSGEHAAAALETLVPADVVGLAVNRQRYALFTNDSGGILDDLMIGNAGDHFLLVINAACKESDTAHLRTHLGDRCRIEALEDRALLALQGPQAGAVLCDLAPDTAEMVFMETRSVAIAGVECFVARSGYTGEDGFEISLLVEHAEQVARTLLAHAAVQPVGLGARDSLRLEAGLCLYGHDIDASTTPVEANLKWAIPKVRRSGGDRAGGFPGADISWHSWQAAHRASASAFGPPVRPRSGKGWNWLTLATGRWAKSPVAVLVRASVVRWPWGMSTLLTPHPELHCRRSCAERLNRSRLPVLRL